MSLLTALDQDVEIVMRREPAPGRQAGSASSQPNRLPMTQKPKIAPRRPRTFDAARRRALTRLRKALNLQWTRPTSRDAFHDRRSRRRDE